jgi:glycosyltransferase involved in cell wall biosynthesis
MVKINDYLTTVSVTYNNAAELSRTLASLSNVIWQPKEIIIIDGGSTDGSVAIIESYIEKMPQMRFISEKDAGIYDAMNKGKRQVKTPLVHYLNAGDVLYGNPYKDISGPVLLPVGFIDENGSECGIDRIKLLGTSYNHQGTVISAAHQEFDLRFTIAADYKMLLQEFPSGLLSTNVSNSGGVKYLLGGISSQKTWKASYQMIRIIFKERPLLGLSVACIIAAKALVPRTLRRWILKRL